ncbi:MAG: hypothetical protein H7X97_05225, partial [Opitutaceae bacterium]|nr:hypothetical protein [Verrucomicrobiales bacterium]
MGTFITALLLSMPVYAATPRTFSYTLPGDCRTSGGIYDEAGTLIRTLWSGKSYTAGTYNVAWDGNHDQHAEVIAPAPEGTYFLKVLANNVEYKWDGVIGNTSSSFASPHIWKALHSPADLAINANGVGLMTAGFCEGQPNARHFLTRDPQTPTAVPDSRDGISVWSHVAIDGLKYYISIRGSDWDENSSNFIIARNIADHSVHVFPDGKDATMIGATGKRTFAGSVDVSQKSGGHDRQFVALNQAGGIAVQQTGNMLAVSHGGLNLVRLFNKTSGAPLGEIAINAPGKLSFAVNGNLWVVNGNAVSLFPAATLGKTNTPMASLPGLVEPIAVTASLTDDNTVLVMENATSQIKGYTFDTTWKLAWTLGQEGGYNATNGPDVTEDAATVKFSFGTTSLCMQADGS